MVQLASRESRLWLSQRRIKAAPEIAIPLGPVARENHRSMELLYCQGRPLPIHHLCLLSVREPIPAAEAQRIGRKNKSTKHRSLGYHKITQSPLGGYHKNTGKCKGGENSENAEMLHATDTRRHVVSLKVLNSSSYKSEQL